MLIIHGASLHTRGWRSQLLLGVFSQQHTGHSGRWEHVVRGETVKKLKRERERKKGKRGWRGSWEERRECRVPIGGSLGVRPARQLEKNLLHKTYWGPPSSEMHSFWCSWVPSLLCCNNRLSFSCVWKPFFFLLLLYEPESVYLSLLLQLDNACLSTTTSSLIFFFSILFYFLPDVNDACHFLVLFFLFSPPLCLFSFSILVWK